MTLEPIGRDVEHELRRLGPGGAIAEVVAVWPDAVGPGIAANAWPARIGRDGTLHVATSSSAWAFELTHLERDVQGRLAERLGEAAPARARFAAGRLPEPGAERVETSERAAAPPSPRALAAGREIAAGIASQQLQEAVARAAAASLARAYERPDDRPF